MSRINTNISAMQTFHTLQKNNAELSKRLQRLSTGLKINAGKDAPAGLIASDWETVGGRRRRAYHLTASGHAALGEQRAVWDQFSTAVTAVLGGRAWPATA